MKIDVIGQRVAAPEALLLHTRGTHRDVGPAFALRRLLPEGNLFDAELSAAWGVTVVGSPEFLQWWRGREGRPQVLFSLEVLK